jgi:hypothetical protein
MFESYSGEPGAYEREYVHVFKLKGMTDVGVMQRLIAGYGRAA